MANMFPFQLLLGGNPLGGAVSGFACFTMIGTTLYAMRKKIPHPSEFALIGFCCLHGGCHKHEKMNLIVEVHEATNIPAGRPVYVYLECGRFDVESSKNPVDKKTGEVGIFERLNIHVRQMDEFLRVSLWRKGGITSTKLGELDLDVLADIIDKNFPQQEWYSLKLEGKLTVKIKLSFHRHIKEGTSPLVEYALIRATREADQNGKEKKSLDFDSLSEKEQLRFLSRILEGPLNVLTSTGWKSYYYKAVEGNGDKWRWSFWESKEAMLKGDKASGSIPLLAISLILPDKHNRQIFYVKYHKKSGVHDVFLSRVDRDRNLWSDGLYEFILRLRAYLEANPPASKSETFVREKVKSEKGKQKIVLQPGLRTLVGPAQRSSTSSTQSEGPKARQPRFLSAMVEEAMEGYHEQDEDSESIGEQVSFVHNHSNFADQPDEYTTIADLDNGYHSSEEYSSDTLSRHNPNGTGLESSKS